MADGKKKCCGKFRKKGKHCGGCPLLGNKDACKKDKDYCTSCDAGKKKKSKKKKQKQKKDKK